MSGCVKAIDIFREFLIKVIEEKSVISFEEL